MPNADEHVRPDADPASRSTQMRARPPRDAACVRALKAWMRFNGEATRCPGWLGGLMCDRCLAEQAENIEDVQDGRRPFGVREVFQIVKTRRTGSRLVVPFNGSRCRQ